MPDKMRTPDELRRAFEIQKIALLDSCASYDNGKLWEAMRIAASVHIFVHDFGKTQSILKQMGKKQSTEFVNFCPPPFPGNLAAEHPLVMLRIGTEGARYLPRLGDGPIPTTMSKFEQWCERDAIFTSSNKKHILTRKKLVFGMRNFDGGAHYDSAVRDSNYNEMVHGNIWYFNTPSGEKKPLRELELATMRQVGWEFTQTLDKAAL